MSLFSAIHFGASPTHVQPREPEPGLAGYGLNATTDASRPGYASPQVERESWDGLPAYRPKREPTFGQSWHGQHAVDPLSAIFAAPTVRRAFPVVNTPAEMAREIDRACMRLQADPAPSRGRILLIGECHHSATAQRALREVVRQVPPDAEFFLETNAQQLQEDVQDAQFELRISPQGEAWSANLWGRHFTGASGLPRTEEDRDRHLALRGLTYRELAAHGLDRLQALDGRAAQAVEHYGLFNHAGTIGLRERGMVESLRNAGPSSVAIVGMLHVGRIASQLRDEGFNVEAISFLPMDTRIERQTLQALRLAGDECREDHRIFVVPDGDGFPAYDTLPDTLPTEP
ncbi:hypothetical protein [Xylophilus sp. GOD-11R]|uniref:hypothetical protein n=1 Tax=Xylophilus sp. GOD-11R TaxID=3089814 RepID=UPI00298D4393|nr:hypothetical protein [Xylophilus sp. GOD-11R]WPB56203.1 hypothetical protein R9X41_18970 [Xylophilus sp. GOD-11R]